VTHLRHDHSRPAGAPARVTGRRPGLALLALGTALTLSACGARVDGELRQAAADEALGRNGGGTGSGGTSGGLDGGTTGIDGGTSGGSAGGSTGAAGTTTGSSGSTGASGSTGSGGAGSSGTTAGAPAPPGGNGGAVDVGVTGDSILLGNVADLSGPVPGLFEGAVNGTQAFIAKVNSEGGVYGRKLKLSVGDGQLDCGQNTAQHKSRVDKVFAFVGSFSLFDNCGNEVLKANPTIPDVHSALTKPAQQLPTNFSIAPLGNGWRTGPLLHYKKKFGDRFQKIGTIYAGVGGGNEIWAGTKAAIESVGGEVLYERAFQPSDTDFTTDIVAMQRAGVRMIYINAADGATSARVVNAARAQGVDWPIVFGAVSYEQGFLKMAGANAEGVYNDQQFALFFNPDEAANVPAVREYQTWMGRANPGKKMDLFSMYGWASADLFVQALKKAGPKATRKDVLAALRTFTKFDAGGILAPANPAGKKPATCWILTQVKGGKYIRVDSPANGFRCDGTYFFRT
jgi:ABC-type branched-subunit amino acid transport system substrate-binding protein